MTREVELITRIAVSPDLRATSMLPEGVIERWLFSDGNRVETGDPVATVRIEDALHELVAPARGRLSIGLKVNSVVEPGTGIGTIIRHVLTADREILFRTLGLSAPVFVCRHIYRTHGVFFDSKTHNNISSNNIDKYTNNNITKFIYLVMFFEDY